jgi:hypothetical protein
VLVADSSSALGVKWAPASGGGAVIGHDEDAEFLAWTM